MTGRAPSLPPLRPLGGGDRLALRGFCFGVSESLPGFFFLF